MTTPTIHSRALLRQMDHYILALASDPSDGRPDVLVSLYWIGYTTELGAPTSGHAAWVWQAAGGTGGEPLVRVLTDAPALVEGLGERMRPGRWDLADPWPAAEAASFERRVLSPYGFEWRIRGAGGLSVEARWEDLGEPVYASGDTRDRTSTISTLLVSAGRAAVTIDGRAGPGQPFPDPIWTPWFGSPQTSCVIGLGETLYRTE